MLKCKEIVKLLNSDEKISLFRRGEIRMHLMLCKHCEAYSRHLGQLKRGFKKLFAKLTSVDKAKVTRLENNVIENLKRKQS
ncbi:MAG: hypothetical protein AB7F86_07470 [Bdellovibrionales bacterium]